MCCLSSALAVQIFVRVILASSPHVDVKVPDPTSLFGCSSDVAKVIFHSVVGHHLDGTQVVFERKWVSNVNAELVLRRSPNPFSTRNIGTCADIVVKAGYPAFEFSNGSCTAVSIINPICCEDSSGSHIYVSQQFNESSLVTTPVTHNNTGVTVQRLPPVLIDLSDISSVVSVIENEASYLPAFWNTVVKGVDENTYNVPLQFIDVENCLSQDLCGPVVVYNMSSTQNVRTVYYLYDYCGGSIPGPVGEGVVMFSHRGFGCEYLPSELEDKECIVQFTVTSECSGCAVVPFFPTHNNGKECDGLTMQLVGEVPNSPTIVWLPCFEKIRYAIELNSIYKYTLKMAFTKPDRLGFASGPTFRVDG